MATASAADVWSDAFMENVGVDEAGRWGEPKRIGELVAAVLARLGLDWEELGQEDLAERGRSRCRRRRVAASGAGGAELT